ncbi:class II glutamine amidotransferase [Francisella halioticida]|uniref:Class II glutamine amidotransferase n=1 Tax=Francisella halioticida TaxID=549298 RepID=A0ABN5AZR0_9GAMM|nr:class II glutamine amidotransferase [Francisella halioticida]ASG67827.1 class II glutamine amidotransferase [Francisella halioticida]BCD90704.1 class II glutamine amidotransferase [Francisella halioticida]
MCRWIMYHGDKIKMSDLLVDPENSLMHQSIHSSEGAVPVNGDGFGISWYTSLYKEPGIYRDPLPAWNNQNLISLAKHIKSKNFMAHVRASTIAPTSSLNCHSFRFERNMFVHNGAIGDFDDIRQEIEQLIKPSYFKSRFGSTDSEALFLLALSNGLENNPKTAISKSIDQVLKIQAKNGLKEKVKASIAYSNGETSYSLKISTIGDKPSLYYINYNDIIETLAVKTKLKKRNGFVVLSEPLVNSDLYTYVDNYTCIEIKENKFKVEKL